MNVREFFNIGRNAVLSFIGWRKKMPATNAIDGHEEEGAIELWTIESRPWWENNHIVDAKLIDWEQDDDE